MNNTVKINKILIICIVLLFGVIIAKLIYVSSSTHIDGIELRKFALSRTTETETIYASRGSIYDCSGEVLALNVNSYTVIAYLSESRTTDKKNPNHVVDKEEVVKKIGPIINMDEDRLRNLLSLDVYQVELGPEGRGISELVKEKIEELNIPGIDFIKESKRYYPFGSFAPYIIGYAKKNDAGDIVGEMGIESYYDEELSGEDGYYTYQKDAYGYQIANTPVQEKKSKDGYDITLTIDSNIQMYLENAINEIDREYDTDWITITVANAKTGAIVGSASNPTFDSNKLNITNYNNPLVQNTYEPGSTMKIFSFMSNIEEGKYDGSEIYSSGSIEVDNYKIKDWNSVGWGKITYDTGFTYSSNVAATKLAQEIGKEKLLDYYSALGFGSKTDIELFGELEGKVHFMYDSELAAASYGQGITVTPIQMIQALTSITNDGVVLKPYIVEHVKDSSNKIVYDGKRQELNKVYSKETVDKIKEIMDLTVNSEDGAVTGKIYQTDKVRLIGKTGTAQYIKDSGGYSTGDYNNIRSFAGIFPKNDPEYIIYIAVKDLQAGTSVIATNVKSIVESISKYKNLNERESNKDETKYVILDNYLNKNVKDVNNYLTDVYLKPIIVGDGSIVVDQFPNPLENVISGSKVFIKTNSNKKIMLNIKGWNRAEVLTYVNMLDIDYVINGTGKVLNFNIKVGDEIKDKLIINLESTEVLDEKGDAKKEKEE